MKDVLTPMVGTRVQIKLPNQGEVSGLLCHLRHDYATVADGGGQPTYVPYNHIVSVITNHTEIPTRDIPVALLAPDTFREILESLRKRLIRIGDGTSAYQGVLSQIQGNQASLVYSMTEMVHYAIHQITCVAPVQERSPSSQASHRAGQQMADESIETAESVSANQGAKTENLQRRDDQNGVHRDASLRTPESADDTSTHLTKTAFSTDTLIQVDRSSRRTGNHLGRDAITTGSAYCAQSGRVQNQRTSARPNRVPGAREQSFTSTVSSHVQMLSTDIVFAGKRKSGEKRSAPKQTLTFDAIRSACKKRACGSRPVKVTGQGSHLRMNSFESGFVAVNSAGRPKRAL